MADSEPLTTSVFHKLSSLLWGLAVLSVVVLAVYVSVGRMLIGNLQSYKGEVLAELNARVPFQIEADTLRGEWHSFTPEIVLGGLRLKLPGEAAEPLELTGGRIGLDVLDTLTTRSLQFTSLQLDNLELRGELAEGGRLVFPGLSGGDNPVGQWLQEFLLNLEYVTLNDNVLRLTLPSGELRSYDLDLHLARAGSTRELQAELVSTRGVSMVAVGRGIGNPFNPENFNGQLYLDIDSADLAAVRDTLVREPPAWMAGQLDSDWWLDWNRGELGVDLQLQVRDARVLPREGGWELPLDELSLTASLVERSNRWTVFASDVVARQGEQLVRLPRLQVDAWGESLRVRASDVELEPLQRLVLALGVLPPKVQSVFEILDPSGTVSTLELALSDVTRPQVDWDVEANFDGVQVQSWKGAPGVNAASGYVDMSQSGGRVVLDSQRFSMDFPTVYAQPLYYDDFFGEIHLTWDEDALRLDSDPITATGVEGTARALFALNIPFGPSDTGLEMDLMVGLANSHPIHRVKYVPTVLNDKLRDWLAGAVGDGAVDQGAFIWRGSLRRGAGDLRTVQLFFNVTNTALSYHPQWPPVDRVNGVVLIDDTNVSVWADTARMYDATLERLSAEAWMTPDQQMMLAVDGSLSGSVADGLRIVNESLLGELTGGAFGEWRAAGQLDARLELLLNLADTSVPPQVSVETELAGVELEILPGGLLVRDLGGELDYATEHGLRSNDLRGRLWDRPVGAIVRQRPLDPSEPSMAFGESSVEVEVRGRVAARALQDWLDLTALELVSGEAEVNGMVEVVPGAPPRLLLASLLEGVALDLPEPWDKPEAEKRAFNLQWPLGGERSLLSMQLGSSLDLDLDISGGFSGAALGMEVAAPELASGVVRVVGSAPLIDVGQWQDFVARYLLTNAGSTSTASAVPEVVADSDVDEDGDDPGLRIQLDDVFAEQVRIWGRNLRDVRFSLAIDSDAWQVQGESDWLRGSYFEPTTGRAGLKLDYLDTSGLDAALAVDDVEESTVIDRDYLELRDMQVVIADLQRKGQPMGDLQFGLASDGPVIRASDIVGNFAGMRLAAEMPGQLDWDQEAGTRLRAQLQFDDLGSTLEQFEYPRFIETERGTLDLDLAWPDSPANFGLATLQGSLVLDLSEGRFLETPAGATGALRVLSVLNLAEVVQRLSLSHMFESGVPFRQAGGQVNFQGGTIEVPELQVLGSSSSFTLSGVSQVSQESLDGELVATLPVANNLPWVAALAGGLPVAAGVFVVSKVFEKQVNRLSSGVYTIGGNWDEPTVTFDRIFDDAARAAAAAGALDPNTPLPDIGLLSDGEAATGVEADDAQGVPDATEKLPAEGKGQSAQPATAPPDQPPPP